MHDVNGVRGNQAVVVAVNQLKNMLEELAFQPLYHLR